MLFKSTKARHTSCLIRSYRSASQGRRLVCHFLLPAWNKTRKCVRDYGPGCNLKALYLCENKRLPAVLLPSRPPPPSFTFPAPSTCGSLFKATHRGLWRPQTGGRENESLEKESMLLLNCRPVCFTPHRGQRKTAPLFRHTKKDLAL